jgi:hypothetical protein
MQVSIRVKLELIFFAILPSGCIHKEFSRDDAAVSVLGKLDGSHGHVNVDIGVPNPISNRQVSNLPLSSSQNTHKHVTAALCAMCCGYNVYMKRIIDMPDFERHAHHKASAGDLFDSVVPVTLDLANKDH